jgi:hypothetical protein
MEKNLKQVKYSNKARAQQSQHGLRHISEYLKALAVPQPIAINLPALRRAA